VLYYYVEAADVASLGIGQTLRQERERQGISLDVIARNTRIQPRFLEAIEADDFDSLPGLIFTRNFVRQYAQALRLDAETVLAGLPKLDESAIRLPDPPKQPRKRTAYSPPGSNLSSLVWAGLAIVAGIVLYTRYNPVARLRADIASLRKSGAAQIGSTAVEAASPIPPQASPTVTAAPQPQVAGQAHGSSVQVVITAMQEAWVQLSADGKPSFTGTLMPNETKEISAAEQVKIVAGNAGGLTVSLNGKPLEPLGPVGQVRVVRLTAEGPQFLPASPQPAPDPL